MLKNTLSPRAKSESDQLRNRVCVQFGERVRFTHKVCAVYFSRLKCASAHSRNRAPTVSVRQSRIQRVTLVKSVEIRCK